MQMILDQFALQPKLTFYDIIWQHWIETLITVRKCNQFLVKTIYENTIYAIKIFLLA